MPLAFLFVSIAGALFTLNAYRPQRRTGWLIIPSFLAGWLTSELALHHLAWQALATGLFVWGGALEAWTGWLGLAITLASWGGLLLLGPIAHRAEPIAEVALGESLGADYRDAILPEAAARFDAGEPPGRRLVPFLLYDRNVRVERDTSLTVVIAAAVIVGCGCSRSSSPKFTARTLGETPESRINAVVSIVEKHATLPGVIRSVEGVQEQIGDGRLGPSDFSFFAKIVVEPEFTGPLAVCFRLRAD